MTNHAFLKLNRRQPGRSSIRRICAGAAVSVVFGASLTMAFTSLAATVYNVGVAGQPEMTEVHTFRKDPVRIVTHAGVPLAADDRITVTPINNGSENSYLVVYKSGKAAVEVDGKAHLIETDGSVANTIAQSGIKLEQGDIINVDLHSLAYDGMEISIDRAFDVFVKDGDAVYTYRTTGCKAGEAVFELGLTLGEEDQLDLEPDAELSEGDTVRILRCVYTDRTAEEELPFETTYVKDNSLFEGQKRMVSAGVPGVQEVVYHEKYLGDACVESQELSRETVKEPVNAVQAVGTRVFRSSKTPISSLPLPDGFELDENGVPAHYKSFFDGVATAYYGDQYTASGLKPGVGHVAVDPRVIPYGTKLWVASLDGQYVYGYAIAADTGGFVEGGWADMDLYMPSEAACWEFGIRGVRIYIL